MTTFHLLGSIFDSIQSQVGPSNTISFQYWHFPMKIITLQPLYAKIGQILLFSPVKASMKCMSD